MSVLTSMVFRSEGKAAATPLNASLSEAQLFLSRYATLSHAQSVQFFDLYSDRAVIHTYPRPQGAEVAFRGQIFKRGSLELLASHRATIEVSEFHEPIVEQRGSRLVIRAKRYSLSRCYWDSDYRVSLESEGANLRIVDERLATSPQSRCDGEALPASTVPLAPSKDKWRTGPQPTWRPLSPDEIAQAAQRLARSTILKSPPMPPPSIPLAVGAAVVPLSSPAHPIDIDTDPLWRTPDDSSRTQDEP